MKPHDIAATVSISCSYISHLVKELHANADPYVKKLKSGCSQKLDLCDLYHARCAIKSGQVPNATALQRKLFPHCSVRTVQRWLCNIGLYG